VEIDGYHPREGYFTALGHRAVYDQEKTMFVIEGKAGQTASITSQRFVGAPPSTVNYRMFKYFLDTGRITAIQPTIQHQQIQQNGRAATPARPQPRR
jgi:hypothetical protein